ncbi:hypothetical protein STRIP9103_01533, partial [Streptomyces ipomoeae 91-03]
PLGWDG